MEKTGNETQKLRDKGDKLVGENIIAFDKQEQMVQHLFQKSSGREAKKQALFSGNTKRCYWIGRLGMREIVQL